MTLSRSRAFRSRARPAYEATGTGSLRPACLRFAVPLVWLATRLWLGYPQVFFGAGESGIAQLWDNNGAFGLNIYQTFLTVGTAFSSGNLGQGSGAVAWATGDFTGSGRTEIAQPWDNNGTLGLNIYGGQDDGTVQTAFSSSDMGQGSGALAWLANNFAGGLTLIAQPWDN